MRILLFDEPFTLTLRMEGTLDSDSAPEFLRAIGSASEDARGRKLLADVGDLRVEGTEADSAILRAAELGVHFLAAPRGIATVLEDEEQRACRSRCRPLRRLGFALTARCRESTRPLCMKLYRLFHSA